MKVIKILLVIAVLFISISAVSAEGNFTALQKEIDSSTDSIEITQDYVYDNSTDYELDSGILINKSDFTINGNGRTIDGSNQARIFNITGNNITISNLIFINGNMIGGRGGALHSSGLIILNNVTFKDNNAENGGAISSSGDCIINSTNFINNTASASGGAIFANGNSNQINATFENNSANNGGAVYFNSGIKNSLINSIFNGNNATRSGGAIFVRGPAINNTITSQFDSNNAKAASGGGIFFYKTAENNKIESIFTRSLTNRNLRTLFRIKKQTIYRNNYQNSLTLHENYFNM